MSPKKKLLILFAFLLIGNIAWYELGGRPQHWDSAIHTNLSIEANRIFNNNEQNIFTGLLNVSWYYPPFTYYSSILFYRLLGETGFTVIIFMSFFLLLLCYSVFKIGSILYNEKAGLTGAFLAAVSPIILEFSRQYMLDLPLAALTALSVWLLLSSDHFSKWKESIFFGAAIGFGFLTKWTFILFILLPLLYEMKKAFSKTEGKRKNVWKMAASFLVSAIIFLPWYITHLLVIVLTRGGELNRTKLPFFKSILYYLSVIPEQVTWPIAVLLFIGFVFYFKKFRFTQPFVLLWLLSSYLFLTLIPFKDPRFSIPLLLPVLIISSSGIVLFYEALKNKRIQNLSVPSALAGFLLLFFAITFIQRSSTACRILAGPFSGSSIINVCGPQKQDWQQDSIISVILADFNSGNNRHPVLRVIPDDIFFNRPTFELKITENNYPLIVSGLSGFPMFTDYVVIKTLKTGEGEPNNVREKITSEILSDSTFTGKLFRFVKKFPLPDMQFAYLYKVETQPLNEITSVLISEKVKNKMEVFVKKYFTPSENYSLTLQSVNPAEYKNGYIEKIELKASSGEMGDFTYNKLGLKVTDLSILIEGLQFIPSALFLNDSLIVKSIKNIEFRGLNISGSDIKDYVELSTKSKIKVNSISIRNGALYINAFSKEINKDFELELGLLCVNNNIHFKINKIKIGFLSLHSSLLNIMLDLYNPLIKKIETGTTLQIQGLKLEGDRLTIQR